MSANDDRYPVKVRCHNCGFRGRLRVLIGAWVTSKQCPRCGVLALQAASAYWWERLAWILSGGQKEGR